MSYCAPSDLLSLIPEDRLIQLLRLGESGGSPSDNDIQPIIDFVDTEIDSALADRYSVPIEGTQALASLKGIAIRIAIAELFSLNADGDIPAHIKDKADKARLRLDEYATGAKSLRDAVRVDTDFLAGDEDVPDISSVFLTDTDDDD